MPEIVTSIDIDAPAEKVWDALVDFAAYPSWNPLVTKIEGDLRVGSRVDFKIRVGSRSMPISAELSRATAPLGLAWIGPWQKPLRFVASGEHYFEIEPVTDDSCRFVHGERFYGLPFRLAWRRLEPDLRRSYGTMNDAIKRYVEA